MKIPNKIIIGKSEYAIKKKRSPKLRGEKIAGSINYDSKKIQLKKGTDDKINQDTFFHEIAHGILKELEFNYPQISKFRNDEVFVQELGLTLRKTFLDLLKKQEKEELC